jgi:hypothetical protein
MDKMPVIRANPGHDLALARSGLNFVAGTWQQFKAEMAATRRECASRRASRYRIAGMRGNRHLSC